MNPDKTPNATALLEMKVEEFFNEERFNRCGVRFKFTRARILHFLDNRNIHTVGAIVEASLHTDLSLGRDFGKTSYDAMVKILEFEGLKLHKRDVPQMSRGWVKAQKRSQQWLIISTQ